MAIEITCDGELVYRRISKDSAGKDVPGQESTIQPGSKLTIDTSQTIEFVGSIRRTMKNTGTTTAKWVYSGYSFDIPAGGTGYFDKSGKVEFREIAAPEVPAHEMSEEEIIAVQAGKDAEVVRSVFTYVK